MTTFSESEVEQLALQRLEELSSVLHDGAPAVMWNTLLLEPVSREVA